MVCVLNSVGLTRHKTPSYLLTKQCQLVRVLVLPICSLCVRQCQLVRILLLPVCSVCVCVKQCQLVRMLVLPECSGCVKQCMLYVCYAVSTSEGVGLLQPGRKGPAPCCSPAERDGHGAIHQVQLRDSNSPPHPGCGLRHLKALRCKWPWHWWLVVNCEWYSVLK